ncbi:MAG: AsmA-like C-terminal region-containing protein, partial [Planctomycetota bacterium]
FEDREQFPYQLTDGVGALRFRDAGQPNPLATTDADHQPPDGGSLSINLIAKGEGRPIRITGEFRDLASMANQPRLPRPGPRPPCPVGWIEIRGDSLRVTEGLLAALPTNAQRVARSLNPAGEFAVNWRMQRETADQFEPLTTIALTAKQCSARYEKFPYPLTGVVGTVNARNGRWWFENVTARAAGGQVVTASGSLDPPPPGASGRPLFRMRVGGAAMPLDDALRGALPASAQQAWNELRPRGRIDFTADVFCQMPAKPRVDLVFTPHQRDLAIEARSFPYRLEHIDGRFVFAGDRLRFEQGRADHGRTQVEGDGAWTPTGGGGWRLDLTRLAVDRLDADHEFRLAAPLDLRRVMNRIEPRGSFGVHNGRIAIIKPDGPEARLAAEWDLSVDFHQADLDGGLKIEDAAGSVRLAGRSAEGRAVTVGELEVDTLFWNGLQVTNVRGPLWCDNRQCLLGAAVASRQAATPQPAQPRRVTGDLYGGGGSLNAQVIFDEQPRYGAAVAFRDIDLRRLTAEYGRAETPVAGRLDGSLELQGLGTTVYGVGGSGELHVREADFGELPVLVSLLKVLRSRAPDKTAFDRCDARFRLQGEHINFEQLDLLGDAINLYGVGEARIDRSLDVAFRTIVSRSEVNAPILRSLMGQASEQLLTIRVGGTMDDPQIRRETLPVVGNVLRQLQQEQPPTNTETTPAKRY